MTFTTKTLAAVEFGDVMEPAEAAIVYWDKEVLRLTQHGEINWDASGLDHWRSLRDMARTRYRQFRYGMWWHNLQHATAMVATLEVQQERRSANRGGSTATFPGEPRY